MEISMNTESALKRLKWLVSKKGNSEDVEAFNSVLGYVALFREKQLKGFPVVAKFFLHEFLLLTRGEQRYDSLTAVNHIKETVKRPLKSYYKTLQKEVPSAQFELLYKDFEKLVREAKRIAEKNKIPAIESQSLTDEYRSEDLEEIIKAKQKAQREYQKMIKILTSENYTEEDAKKFTEKYVTELLIYNND